MIDSCNEQQSWVQCYKSRPNAKYRLFCFPYAGAGGGVFRFIAQNFPEEVEVFFIEYPGRGTRLGEPLCSDVDSLVLNLREVLDPLLDRPFAVLGYSFGTLVAFEWMRGLSNHLKSKVMAFFVCAGNAPHIPAAVPLLCGLNDQAFITGVQCRYGGIPEVVLREPELLAIFLPALRADLRAFETHFHTQGDPLPCPIYVFGGEDDAMTCPEYLQAWQQHTYSECQVKYFPGGHFFLHDNPKTLCDEILGLL